MKLQGKVAVISGSAQGIGRACAERFAAEGATVVVSDIDEDGGEATAEAIRKAGGNASFVYCDVGEKLDVRNLVAGIASQHGALDICVCNAGIVHGADFLELKEADFDRVLKINLKGTFLLGQAAARRMVEQVEAGGVPGTIINMSSVNAVFAIPNQVPYTISKGGVNQLTKVMALSLAQYGIRVNAIGPGSIMTDILKAVANDQAAMNKILSRTPLGRVGDVSEVASVAAFLASDDASYITGQTIYPDGGRLPLNYTVPVPSS
jgi:NAD(P)-dependent dehydrogenase (short-subunit alcohol dehydrogenase family)